MYKESELTRKIIGLAMLVHREIGPGFQEKVYHRAMLKILDDYKTVYESEREYDIFFKNEKVGIFRADLVVEGKIIVELKSVCGEMPDLFKTQIISYLKASKLEVGLLINFGNRSLDVKRLANYKNFKSV